MTTPRRPPGRYDEPRSLPRWALWTGAAVLGVVLLALTFAASQRFSRGTVPFTLQSYRVVSDRQVEVVFEVHKRHGATATCGLRARDLQGAVVGEITVTVGPGDGKVTELVATTSRAVIGEVTLCRSA